MHSFLGPSSHSPALSSPIIFLLGSYFLPLEPLPFKLKCLDAFEFEMVQLKWQKIFGKKDKELKRLKLEN